jgi:hypothetical protein
MPNGKPNALVLKTFNSVPGPRISSTQDGSRQVVDFGFGTRWTTNRSMSVVPTGLLRY